VCRLLCVSVCLCSERKTAWAVDTKVGTDRVHDRSSAWHAFTLRSCVQRMGKRHGSARRCNCTFFFWHCWLSSYKSGIVVRKIFGNSCFCIKPFCMSVKQEVIVLKFLLCWNLFATVICISTLPSWLFPTRCLAVSIVDWVASTTVQQSKDMRSHSALLSITVIVIVLLCDFYSCVDTSGSNPIVACTTTSA